MPKNLISLAEQFGGIPCGPGRRQFILTNPKAISTLLAAAKRIGASAVSREKTTPSGRNYTVVNVSYVS